MEPRAVRPVRRWRRARWWVPAALALVGVLLAAGVWGRYVWLPSYRPDLRAGERYGVDVSNHQGEIDWPRVADDGIAFAYIKASEGVDFVDPWFARNWAGAGAAGLRRGAYHFFTLCDSGAAQAENFLRTARPDPAALPPAVDLELGGNCSARPGRDRLLRELTAFLDRVEAAAGRPAVLYVLDGFERRYRIRQALDRPRWERRILLRPRTAGWWIWQFQGYASVDGITGRADLNVMREPA